MARPDIQALGPPMHVTALTASWAGGSVGLGSGQLVAATASFSIQFDRYVLPTDAARQSVCLQPGTEVLTSLEQCSGRRLVASRYDPVTRTVTYETYEVLPSAGADMYTLTLFSAANGGTGFRAFDGAALVFDGAAKGLSVSFMVGSDVGQVPQVLPGNLPFVPFCNLCRPGCETNPYGDLAKDKPGAGQVLRQQCGSNCHTTDTSVNPPALPAMGLELDSLQAVEATAVGQVAHQTELGGKANTATENPARFGVAMPRIDGGHAGNSYVLYKILSNPGVDGWPGSSTLAKGETERLRRSLVSGMPMPAAPYPSLSQVEAEIISEWIRGGAGAFDCERSATP